MSFNCNYCKRDLNKADVVMYIETHCFNISDSEYKKQDEIYRNCPLVKFCKECFFLIAGKNFFDKYKEK